MSKNTKYGVRYDTGIVEIKSKFCAEFRRFSIPRRHATKYQDFEKLVGGLHCLEESQFVVCYTDPEGDLLPINNDDNYARALTTAKPMLRILVQRRGENLNETNGYGTLQKKRNPILSKLIQEEKQPRAMISLPQDFRRVSAIIDVDVIPETHRRVKLMKNGSDKPLGFYIRDGTSVRVTSRGLEKVPGIFISRLVPGGLAESTGLLAVNDEVLEVNGIEVAGKTLDQVTDMMVANSANLIITVKPVNQRNNIPPNRAGSGRLSQKSTGSLKSAQSALSAQSAHSGSTSFDSDDVRQHIAEDDEDLVREHLASEADSDGGAGAGGDDADTLSRDLTTAEGEGEDGEATLTSAVGDVTLGDGVVTNSAAGVQVQRASPTPRPPAAELVTTTSGVTTVAAAAAAAARSSPRPAQFKPRPQPSEGSPLPAKALARDSTKANGAAGSSSASSSDSGGRLDPHSRVDLAGGADQAQDDSSPIVSL